MALLIETEAPPLQKWDDGSIRVGDSRVPLERIVYAYNVGDAAEEIQMDFETLSLADIYGAIAYYLGHKDAVDQYIRERKVVGGERQETHGAASTKSVEIRKRLLVRQRERGLHVAPRG